MRYLFIDNCAIHYLLRSDPATLEQLEGFSSIPSLQITIPVISHFEQMRGLRSMLIDPKSKELGDLGRSLLEPYRDLVHFYGIKSLTSNAGSLAAEVYARRKKRLNAKSGEQKKHDSDILIAGMALDLGAELLTDNSKDFADAEQLGVVVHRLVTTSDS